MSLFHINWGESESEKAQREHNEGQEFGAHADIIEDFLYSNFDKGFRSDAYNAGVENGFKNRPQAE